MNKKGFSLIELLVVILIAGTISTIAVSNVWNDIPEHNLKENIRDIEQILIKAKSTAIKTSSTIVVDFDQADSNNGQNGGIIKLKNLDDEILETLALYKNVRLNTNTSTMDEIRLNYRGEPVDDSNQTSTITDSNNSIVFSYYKNNAAVHSRALTISPITGNIEF